jgi:hypothetical protein
VDARSAGILAGRATAYGLAAVAVAILANTAVGSCQNRDDGAGQAAAGAPAGPTTPAPIVPGAPPDTAPPATTATTSAPAASAAPAVPPQVSAAQLRALAGRWLSSSRARDYFVFKADGTGAWLVRGRALWRGEVIPTGQGVFRLAWQSTIPHNAAYWHVTLFPGGRRLLFDGTRQQYRKV